MTIRIEVSNDKVNVYSPYNPDFPSKAKAIGGKWSAGSKAWQFDARDETRVRELCKAVYGTDGLEAQKLVTVRVDATGELNGSEFYKFGRQIARRPGRDAAVRLGDGVIMIEGSFPSSAGSARYPSIIGRSDSRVIFEIRDIPESMALAEIEKDPEAVSLVEEIEPKTQSPLATVTDAELVAELERRGYKVAK